MIHSIRKKLQRNRFIIKVYSIFPWNKIIPTFKQFLFDLKMKKNGFIFLLPKSKTKFFLPSYKQDFIQNSITKTKNYFEYDNLDYITNKWKQGTIGKSIFNSVVLDIGTNIGNHTLFYLLENKASKVYCFEPAQTTFSILEKNIKINNIEKKVSLSNVGVGQKKGHAIISNYNPHNIGGTTIESDENGEISIIAIDEITFPSKIALVKIDVEGFELNVIKGMIKTLKDHKPYITIEIRDKNFHEIHSMLKSIGYTYIELEEHKSFRDYNDYLFFIE